MRLIRYADLAAAPWKNGGGVTRELACHPEGTGLEDFTWRVSIADVASSGPFSLFPGVERVIMLLEGEGMQLQFENGKRHALTEPLQPYRFRGEAQLYAQLVGGASKDFNLMFRREQADGQVFVWRSENTLTGGFVLVHCAVGTWQVAEYRLGPHDTLVGTFPAGTALEPLEDGSVMIGVHVERKIP